MANTLPTLSSVPQLRLGEILLLLFKRGALSQEDLERLLLEYEGADAEGVPLSNLLLSQGLVSEADLLATIADQAGTTFVDLAATGIDPMLERIVPLDIARQHLAVAVALEGETLVVAMVDPSSEEGIADLKATTGHDIKPVLAARTEIEKVLKDIYGAAAEIDELYSEAEQVHIDAMLNRVVDLGGSDLHLTVGIEPVVRVHGDLKPLTEFPKQTGPEIRRMIYAILSQKQRERLEDELELDASYSVHGLGRFRLNVFIQRGSVGAVLRVIPSEIKALADLGVPAILENLARLPRGLVLVTGPTGSGKSTTLASMVDLVNSSNAVHIMTVEDPIEFLHNHKQAVVNQREVGEDTRSFANALKHVLRQDPDVILVGELRDLETISTALTAAETGHLVFATLHTQDAPQSIDRIIDVFPPHQQQQVRVQLASSLQGIATQQLVPTEDGKGRRAAVEVLIATPAVRNLIREGKSHQIPSSMQAGGKFGMQTMDQSLAALVKSGDISIKAALTRCASEDELHRLVNTTQ